MRLLLLTTFILQLQLPFAYSQSINYNNPDLALLGILTQKAVNKVRKKNNCQPLAFNDTLLKAAKNHANHIKTHEVGHYQPDNPEKETVQKRVEYFGGKQYYAGENVLMTSIRPGNLVYRKKAKTYKQLANALAAGWVNSPGHFKNMTSPNYSITAVALSYLPEKQLLFAVQVFAFKKEDTYPMVKISGSLKKYPHKLKLMPEGKREDLAETFRNLSSLSLTRTNNRLVMTLMDKQEARELQKLIGGRRDGLVVEKVIYDPYRCGNPAYEEQPGRRNGRYFLNGDLLKPFYRNSLYEQLSGIHVRRYRQPTVKKAKKLKRDFRKNKKKVPYWLIDLGAAPDPYADYNLMLIKNKKLSAVNHFYSLPGDVLPPGPLPSMRPYWLPGHFSFSPGTGELVLNVPFGLNQSSLPEKEIEKLLMIDSLKKLPIQKIEVEAFASVEGDFEINQDLHQKRATFIISQLQQHLPDSSIKYRTKTGENWPEFARQIRYSPYSYLLRQDKMQVKEFLRTCSNDTIQQLLQNQRKALVRITFLDTSGRFDTLGIVSNEWDSLIHLAGNKMPQRDQTMMVRKLEVLQKFLYNQYLQSGKGELSSLVNVPFPREPMFAQLINNRNWFLSKLAMDDYPVNAEDIGYCAESFEVSDIGKYNFMIYHLQKHNYSRKILERMDFHFKRMNWSYFETEEQKKIAFNLYLQLALKYSADLKDFEEMQQALKKTMQNYPLKNKKDSLSAAGMYACFGQDHKAFYLIKPIIESGKYETKTLIFFLKLAVQLPSEKFYEYLKYYRKYLSRAEWCGLFRGNHPISFQFFDHAPLRDLYCQTCED